MRNVKIISDGGTYHNTYLVDLDTDQPILGIKSLDISIRPKDVNRAIAVVELIKTDISAEMRFLAPHPITGALTEVKSIEFVSGERVEF